MCRPVCARGPLHRSVRGRLSSGWHACLPAPRRDRQLLSIGCTVTDTEPDAAHFQHTECDSTPAPWHPRLWEFARPSPPGQPGCGAPAHLGSRTPLTAARRPAPGLPPSRHTDGRHGPTSQDTLDPVSSSRPPHSRGHSEGPAPVRDAQAPSPDPGGAPRRLPGRAARTAGGPQKARRPTPPSRS